MKNFRQFFQEYQQQHSTSQIQFRHIASGDLYNNTEFDRSGDYVIYLDSKKIGTIKQDNQQYQVRFRGSKQVRWSSDSPADVADKVVQFIKTLTTEDLEKLKQGTNI